MPMTNEHESDTTESPGWEYSPAPERVKVDIEDSYGLFINGAFRAPKSRKRFDTVNPATERPLSSIAEAGPKDVDAAVQSAREALPAWSRLKPRERAKYLYRIARRLSLIHISEPTSPY